MTDFRGNIDHWIRQSEPDYYMFFVKAWIPFNAWYVAELPNLNKKDTAIIQELQDNPKSKPRNFIETFLSNNKPDSIRFKSHLAELHHLLEIKSLKHNGKKLSFNSISLAENPNKFEKDTDKAGNIFKAERTQQNYEAIIVDKNKKKIMHIKQNPYDLEAFKKHNDYIKITPKNVQSKILKCYEAIDPNKPISLISKSKIKSEYIILNSENKINFINDPTTIAKACIKILYTLRCMLFHGELEPNFSNISVYEHSYQMLRLILKELK
jgi:hypothetical protein